MAKTDKEIIQAAKEDLSMFKILYDKWISPVYRYFLHRVNNVKEAEDLTSQVFLKVIERLPRYRENGHFPAWLFTIARHQWVDHLRESKDNLPIEAIKLHDGTGDLLDRSVKTDEFIKLRHLIDELSQGEQELIRLRFVAELNYKEISIVLRRSPDAIRKKLFRVLDELRQQMEEDYA